MDEEDYQESIQNEESSSDDDGKDNYKSDERDDEDVDEEHNSSDDNLQYILSKQSQQQHTQQEQPKEVLTTNFLDKNLLNFLLEHQNELTLNVLQKVHKIINSIRMENSNIEIDQYFENLKLDKLSLFKQFKELQESKKGLEYKLQLLKKRYEDELNSNMDIKIDNIFKNSGAKEFLDKLKSSDKAKSDMISNLKQELETMKKELELIKNKYYKAEEQCEHHKQQWRDVQAKKWNLEAEKTASQNRDRQILEQTMNRSYASSYLESNQPPPPVSIPTIEEILNSNDNGSSFDYSNGPIAYNSSSSLNQQQQQQNNLFYSDNVSLKDRRLNNTRI